MNDYFLAFLGGSLIGLAVSLMLFWNGRVTGISGIVYGAAVNPVKGDRSWRWSFIGGLVLGGLALQLVRPTVFSQGLQTNSWTVVVAGVLVGFGTVLGNGCTSGHGVCGISRLSRRSFVATGVFVTAGILSVFLFKQLGLFP